MRSDACFLSSLILAKRLDFVFSMSRRSQTFLLRIDSIVESSLKILPVLAKTVAPKIVSCALSYIMRIICHTLTISTACFLDALPRGSLFLYASPWVYFLRNVKFNVPLGINTGMLGCIVKLPDEVCVSHTKRIGENKAVLQL